MIFVFGVVLIILGIVLKNLTAVFILFGLFLCLFGLVACICLFCCRSRINIVIQLIKEASHAIRGMPCVCGVTMLQSLITGAFVVLAIIAIALLPRHWKYVKDSPSALSSHQETSTIDSVMIIILIITLLWVTMWIVGINELTIAGVMCDWYFTVDKQNQLPRFPVG
jgi:hypothetical protein